MKIAAVATLAPVILLAALLFSVSAVPGTSADVAAGACVPMAGASNRKRWDDEQVANARFIVRIGEQRGIVRRGLVVALAASMQESSLRNLPSGDRDSAGLFQMRPSMGWGTYAQVTDPVYATHAFFGGDDHPPANPGLLDVHGWERLSVAEAAQSVERSAFPDAYAKWEPAAALLVDQLADTTSTCAPAPGVGDCPPTGLAVEQGLTGAAQRVVRCEVARFGITVLGGRATGGHVEGSDHYTGRGVDVMISRWQTPEGRARGDEVAAYFVEHASHFDITYVIWDARIWSTNRPTWRPYRHPSGSTNPTLQHLDHVHISVA